MTNHKYSLKPRTSWRMDIYTYTHHDHATDMYSIVCCQFAIASHHSTLFGHTNEQAPFTACLLMQSYTIAWQYMQIPEAAPMLLACYQCRMYVCMYVHCPADQLSMGSLMLSKIDSPCRRQAQLCFTTGALSLSS